MLYTYVTFALQSESMYSSIYGRSISLAIRRLRVVHICNLHSTIWVDVAQWLEHDHWLSECCRLYVIYETRGRVFHHISKHREVWTHFEVFGYAMKHSSECFILHLKQMRILGENWEESWFNLCKFFLTYPNSVSVLISFVFILWIINEF